MRGDIAEGLQPPDVSSAVLEKLVASGHAYENKGNVYFSIASDPDFGKLSHVPRGEMLPIANEPHIEHVLRLLQRHGIDEAVFLSDTVYVMSSRPGRIVRRCPVNLPRPRDLEVTYTPQFQDVVHELRTLIRG